MRKFNIRKVSVNSKIWALAVINVLGLLVIIGGYAYSAKLLVRTQEKIRRADTIGTQISEITLSYYQMVLKTVSLIASPTEANLKAKEDLDDALDKLLVGLKQQTSGTALESKIRELSEFDEQYLNPLDLTLQASRKSNSAEQVLKIYDLEYAPLVTKLNGMLKDIEDQTQQDVRSMLEFQAKITRTSMYGMVLVLVSVLLLSVAFTRILGRAIVGPLEEAITELDEESAKTRTSAGGISRASLQLAESASKQAEAIQQTSASVSEMNAMIGVSSTNAAKSNSAAHNSADMADKGKNVVVDTIRAIEAVHDNNQRILAEITTSNQQLGEISGVIQQIAEKTKVINEIVFQTRLLSFNASVEAARAGDHGKGFAVVAEEIGNLADMSGKSAQEIEGMLVQSMERVEGIVSTSQSKIGALIEDAQSRAESSSQMASKSGQVLDEVVTEAKSVSALVEEISGAAAQQAKGIEEISQAVDQFNKTTKENSEVSNEIAASAEELLAQAEKLGVVTQTLKALVYGENAQLNESPTKSQSESPRNA